MTAIRAHFDGKVFVPDEPVNAPLNQEATILLGAPVSAPAMTEAEFENLVAEMDRDAVTTDQVVDWSRDSIYSGTLDDTR